MKVITLRSRVLTWQLSAIYIFDLRFCPAFLFTHSLTLFLSLSLTHSDSVARCWRIHLDYVNNIVDAMSNLRVVRE